VTTNTTFRDARERCNGPQTLMRVPANVAKDFLTPFLYIESQRYPGLTGSVPNVLSNHVKPFHRESFGNKPHTFGTLPGCGSGFFFEIHTSVPL
jgi:hypothetical protein